MFKSLIFTLVLCVNPVMAQENLQSLPNEWALDEAYYNIGSVDIQEAELTAEEIVSVYSSMSQQVHKGAPLSFGDVTLDQIVNMGKKVWKVIVDNKPVVNVQLQRANAVPAGADSWLQLANWRDPVAKKYQVSYKNLYGMEVVRFDFLVTYAYNGQVNGKGRYLSEVGFVPSTVTVAWMYNFNVTSQVVRTINVGTSDDPIAGIELNLNWVVKTPLKEDQRTNNFYIRGDGGYRAL